MTWKDAACMAAATLRKNPVRTLLTILGLGVGIAAVLTVLTLGSAGEAQVELQIARLGVDKVWITPEEGNLLTTDAGATVAALTQSSACAGAYTMGAVRLGEQVAMAQVCGYDAGMEHVHHPSVVEGRMFRHSEYQGTAVGLMDEKLLETLGEAALGQYVDVGSRRIRIVGIVTGMQVQAASMANGMIILPLQTMMDTFASAQVQEVTLNIPRGERADEVGQKALSALGEGYQMDSLQEEIDAARAVVRIFVMVLGCVAAVCILTGGIGVMNILLVSVRERRREIGLIKAIGGTSRQVGLLFLMEAVGYTVLGGVLGIGLAIILIGLFGRFIGLDARLSAAVALPALLVAAMSGAGFGVLPALRAAGMLPVSALKNE